MTATKSQENPINEPPAAHVKRVIENVDGSVFSELKMNKRFDKIVLAGMGGSGIAGMLVANLCEDSTAVIVVRNSDRLPSWADKDTLVVVSSYSGNTYEMLRLYDESVRKGCFVVAITSGGSLKEYAERDGTFLLTIKGGHMPRSDVGFMLYDIMAIIDINNGNRKLTGEFIETLKRISPYVNGLADRHDESNEALHIAKKLRDHIPFFYTVDSYSSVALRWKTQFNENSKKVASCSTFPEFNHNELEGWARNERESVLPVLLRPETDDVALRYIDTCADVMNDLSNPFYTVDLIGDTHMERVLKGCLLSDYVSIYVAEELGIDPSPVMAIAKYKEELKNKQ